MINAKFSRHLLKTIMRLDMKNIGILYDALLHIGGVESHLLSLLRGVDSTRYRYTIIAPVSDKFTRAAESLGARVIPWSHWTKFNPQVPLQIRWWLNEEKIDLAHIHSPAAGISARWAARLKGLPILVTVHLPARQYFSYLTPTKTQAGRWIYVTLDRWFNHLLTDRMIYVSEKLRNEAVRLHQAPASRSMVIPNGIQLSRYNDGRSKEELRRELGIPLDQTVMTFVGRLDNQKGLDVLLNAASGLMASRSNLSLVLVGDGPLRIALGQQVSQLGLEKRVQFRGYQDNVAEYLQASDFFVLPSRYEAMSLVLLEAIAAGLPCVVTSVGENTSMVSDGKNGLVVPMGQIEPLKNAIARMAEDAELRQRMGAASRAASQKYDDLDMARRVQAVYDELL